MLASVPLQTALPVIPPGPPAKQGVTVETVSKSNMHISDTPPHALAPTQETEETTRPADVPMVYAHAVPLPASPVNFPGAVKASEENAMEYTWPRSSQDVDMTSGDEPLHTTLLPPKEPGVPPTTTPVAPPPSESMTRHPAIMRAVTSIVLGHSIEPDKEDIFAGVPLPIISEPLLPSIILINEEESLLFSHIKPLQGEALIRAAGITKDDLPAKSGHPKPKWSVPVVPQETHDDAIATTQEPTYDLASDSETYEDIPLSEGLRKMQSAFPEMSEEHLTIALQKHELDLPSALAWMWSVLDMREMRTTLLSAFPTADADDVEGAII